MFEFSLQVRPNVCHSLAIEIVGRRQRDNQKLVTALEVRGRLFSQTKEDDLDLDRLAGSHDRGVRSYAVELGSCGLDLECNGHWSELLEILAYSVDCSVNGDLYTNTSGEISTADIFSSWKLQNTLLTRLLTHALR